MIKRDAPEVTQRSLEQARSIKDGVEFWADSQISAVHLAYWDDDKRKFVLADEATRPRMVKVRLCEIRYRGEYGSVLVRVPTSLHDLMSHSSSNATFVRIGTGILTGFDRVITGSD